MNLISPNEIEPELMAIIPKRLLLVETGRDTILAFYRNNLVQIVFPTWF